jgi:hypothetical protein
MILLDRRSVRGIAFGLVGGFVGTALMDTIIVATFLLIDQPGDTFFVMVGDRLGQGPAVGIALHNLIGLSVGFLFAVVVLNVKVLNVDTTRKGLVLGVLAGAVTIPVGCIPFAIWLGEPVLEVVALSTIPHLVYGTILGRVVAYGLLHE